MTTDEAYAGARRASMSMISAPRSTPPIWSREGAGVLGVIENDAKALLLVRNWEPTEITMPRAATFRQAPTT